MRYCEVSSKNSFAWVFALNSISSLSSGDKSYNDFFTRKINVSRRPINTDKKTFISPCDSKLSVYTINEDKYCYKRKK